MRIWIEAVSLVGLLIATTTYGFGWWDPPEPFEETDPPHWVRLVWCGLTLLVFAITTGVALWTSTTER